MVSEWVIRIVKYANFIFDIVFLFSYTNCVLKTLYPTDLSVPLLFVLGSLICLKFLKTKIALSRHKIAL